MASQQFGLGFVIGGTLSSSFKSAFKTSNTNITNINSNIAKLSQTRVDIKNFKALSKDSKKNKTELSSLARTLKGVGVSVTNFDRDSRSLRMTLIKLKKAAKIDIKITDTKSKLAEQKNAILGIGAAMYGTVNVIRGANNVLKAQGEIRSLDISTAGIDGITKAGQRMSLQYGQITAPQFIKASYDIKSGIASLSDTGVKEFTNFASVTAVATKSSTAEMTKLYALGYGIFRKDFTSDMDFGKQFSGAIAGAVQAFRTDGSDLSQGLSNLGGTATALGISMAEQIAIIGTAKSTYSTASEASTGYKAMLAGLGKAQEKMGMNFKDAQGNMLPLADILDKLKDKYGGTGLDENVELQEMMGGSEATKFLQSMMNDIDGLRDSTVLMNKAMEGGLSKAEAMAKGIDSGYGFEKMGNAMSYMGFTIGKAVAPAVDMLATGLGGLAKGVAWLDEKVPFLVPVFAGLAAGVVGLVTVLKIGTLSKLAFSLATDTVKKSVLLSSASNLYNSLTYNRISASLSLATIKTWGFNLATKAASKSQRLLAASCGFASLSLKSIGGFFGGAKTAALAIVPIIRTLTLGMLRFNLALLANPIGLVVGAIAIGATLIYKYWQPITAFFKGVFSGIKTTLAPVITAFKPLFTLLSPLGDMFSAIGDGISVCINWLSELFTPVEYAQDSLNEFTSTGEKVGEVIGTMLMGLLSPITLVSDGITWLGEKLGLLDGKSATATLVEKKETTQDKTTPRKRLGTKAAVKYVAPAFMATQLAAAPLPLQSTIELPKAATLNIKKLDTPIASTNRVKAQPAQVTQQNTIHVSIENPSDNIDVERAITNAMRQHGKSTTNMMDEDL